MLPRLFHKVSQRSIVGLKLLIRNYGELFVPVLLLRHALRFAYIFIIWTESVLELLGQSSLFLRRERLWAELFDVSNFVTFHEAPTRGK